MAKAKAKAKAKAAAVTVPVPQSIDEARDFIASIGLHQRERERLATRMNARIELTKLIYVRRAVVEADAIKAFTEGLAVWAAAHRTELTKDGKTKTAVLATGELRWRMTPRSVALRNVKDVLAALKAAALDRFIRVKEEIDKEAILREPEAIADVIGISITQREEFVIVPNETKLEEIA